MKTSNKPKKGELIDLFLNILNESHWDIISELLGRKIIATGPARKNLLANLFKKTIGISSRKGKGRTLQKWVSEQISELTGIPCGKDEEITSREMGQSGTDVRLSNKVLKLFPYSVECKNCENWSLPSFIAQAKRNQLPNTDWILFLTKNGHEEIAVLNAKSFFDLLRKK